MMGIWIELFVFGLVFLFAWHQFRDLRKEKEKRQARSSQETEGRDVDT